MKRIISILLILTCAIFTQAQNPIPADSNTAITQSLANAPTTKALTNILQAKKGFINGVFPDTTTANLYNTTTGGYRLKYFPGAQIFTTDSSRLWVRNKYATQWLRSGGNASGTITSLTMLTDSSVIICYQSGCDTIPFNNFTNNITVINDSTIQICDGVGNCVTVNLGNSNSYYLLNDSTLVTCDTTRIDCVGDDCTQTTLCDTVNIPRIIGTVYQNGVRKVGNIVEWGVEHEYDNTSYVYHPTWIKTGGVPLYFKGGVPNIPLFNIINNQWTQVSSYVASMLHNGAYRPGWNLLDSNNQVQLNFNYTDPFYIPSLGSLAGDTIGYMGNRYGYFISGNLPVKDFSAKQAGIFIDTYSPNNEGVTIFAQQVPQNFTFENIDSTLLDKRVAIFKTDGTTQLPYYPNTRNDGVTGIAFYPDADGNIKLGATAGGGSITFDNDTVIICSFGNNLCDTFITTLTDPIQYVTVIDDTTLRVCDTTGACENIDVGGSGSGGIGVDQKFFEPSQVQNTDTYHEMSKNFSVGINLTTSVSGVRNYNFLNGNTVSGSENVVWGRNMVVSGNTNFVAATDGTMASGNYSAVFGDANDVRATASLTGGFGNDAYVENGFVMGNDNVLGALSAGAGTANQYTGSWMLGSQNRSTGSNNGTLGYFVQNTGARAIVIGNGFGSTRFTNSMANVIAFTTNSDSATMYVHPAAGTTGSIGKVSIGTAAPTATRFEVVDNTIGNANMVRLASTSTAASGSGQRLLAVTLSGANSNSSETTQSIYVNNSHTGTGSNNQAIFTTTSGGASNYGINSNASGSSATANYALYGVASGSSAVANYGVNASATGVSATTNYGGVFTAQGGTTNYAIIGASSDANSNTVITNTRFERNNTAGAGADGIGLSLDFYNETTSSGSLQLSNQITSKWPTAADATRTSQLDITGVNSASTQTIMSAYGTGVVGIGISSSYTATRLEVVDNAATTQTVALMSSTSITSGSVLSVSLNGTGAASNTQTGINVNVQGANATASMTTYGVFSHNQHTGSGQTINIGVLGQVTNGSTSSAGVRGQASTQIGVWGDANSSGTGVFARSSSGYGINAETTTGAHTALFSANPATTNTVQSILRVQRITSGTAAAGIGGSIEFYIEDAGGGASGNLSNQLISSFTNAGVGTNTSEFKITGLLAGATVDLLTLAGDGSVKLRPITAAAASAITPANGMILYTSDTDGTFVSIGFWVYEAGAWRKM